MTETCIVGKLILAGDYTEQDQVDPKSPLARVVVVMPHEALKAVKTLPMYQDVAVVPKAEADKFALIRRVLTKAFDETDSWQEDNVGDTIAYLAHAIATDSKVCFDADWTLPILALFKQWFEDDDPVWAYIEEPPVTDEERANGPRRA